MMMIEALRKVIKRMHYPLEVILTVLVQIAGTVARTPLCYVAFQVPSTAFQTAGATRP
jgi:hypothetical protein